MRGSVRRSAVVAVQAVVGDGLSEMDIIRYLHLANNDVTRAINLLLDRPPQPPPLPPPPLPPPPQQQPPQRASSSPPAPPKALAAPPTPPPSAEQVVIQRQAGQDAAERDPLSHSGRPDISNGRASVSIAVGNSALPATRANGAASKSGRAREKADHGGVQWWLFSQAHVAACSVTKGPKLKVGEVVQFTFPKRITEPGGVDRKKPWGAKGRLSAGSSEIVRFGTVAGGEIGRLPNELGKALVPLVLSGKARVEATCISAPSYLQMMDPVYLDMRVYVSSVLFKSPAASASASAASALSETTTGHPLSLLLRFFHMEPSQKAEFTPEDFEKSKRALQGSVTAPVASAEAAQPTTILPAAKRVRIEPAMAGLAAVAGGGDEGGEEGEKVLSDSEVSRLVGTTAADELAEMDPPDAMTCDLRPYQKQALHWMLDKEISALEDSTSQSLHPCWEAYDLADERRTPFYHNVFSGEASLDFPSSLQRARGGILGDAMGLGKTVMTLSLLVANRGRGGNLKADTAASSEQSRVESGTAHAKGESDEEVEGRTRKSRKRDARGGGTLIVCPMTLLSQWKAESETHVKAGTWSVYTYYGTDRAKERRQLLEHDVVLTSYGVLASECNNENFLDDGPVHSVHWHRVVLDEAHTIKAFRTQNAKAVYHLNADHRWCLTGTPIQNQLEDIFSLLHFLRVEPWANWGWWNKLIQKPYEDGDQRSLKLLQGILKPLMLRRTKESTDTDGKPILIIPAATCRVVECDLSETEQDFYDALYKRSKVKFDDFVRQGKVLHNYASILELLLRLRQCCDHPFLVLSRGDTADFADLNKLGRKFLKNGGADGPSKKFVQGVVEELRKGQSTECPICLDPFEDAVFTPCAHCFCRECLLSSFSNTSGGICPVCRLHVGKADLITAPSESRFQVDVEASWTPSAKVNALMAALDSLRASGEKSIVFSQWTAFLDLLQIPLKRNNYSFVRLDGSLSQQQREKAIKEFSTNSCIQVMLISLKAGGVGINLTAASNAFLLDPWWNPAVEEQAIMRVHRIGQTRPVSVTRFIIKGTVEERMQVVQKRKQQLVNGALTDQEVRSARIEELKMLFR